MRIGGIQLSSCHKCHGVGTTFTHRKLGGLFVVRVGSTVEGKEGEKGGRSIPMVTKVLGQVL